MNISNVSEASPAQLESIDKVIALINLQDEVIVGESSACPPVPSSWSGEAQIVSTAVIEVEVVAPAASRQRCKGPDDWAELPNFDLDGLSDGRASAEASAQAAKPKAAPWINFLSQPLYEAGSVKLCFKSSCSAASSGLLEDPLLVAALQSTPLTATHQGISKTAKNKHNRKSVAPATPTAKAKDKATSASSSGRKGVKVFFKISTSTMPQD